MAIRYRLKALIEHKESLENRKITYRKMASESGVSTNTITNIATQKAEYIHRKNLDRLCKYFSCTPGDIIIYVPDEDIIEQDE